MEGEFQVCWHCKRNVPSALFVLHESRCQQFLVSCPKCKEPVPEAKMKEDYEECHPKVKCAMCQQSVQKSLLELHETEEYQECPVKCKFCELTVHLSKLETHESYCGSQTQRCPHCDYLILLWLLAHHKDVCWRTQSVLSEREQLGEAGEEEKRCEAQSPEPLFRGMQGPKPAEGVEEKGKRTSVPERKIYCNYCNEVITGSKRSHYMDDCSAVLECLKNLIKSFPSRTNEGQTPTAEKDVHPKTRNTNRFPLLSECSTKQAPRDKNRTTDLPSKSELQPRTSSPTEDEAACDLLGRCLQCGIQLPLPILKQHQVKCQRLASLKGKQVRKSS